MDEEDLEPHMEALPLARMLVATTEIEELRCLLELLRITYGS